MSMSPDLSTASPALSVVVPVYNAAAYLPRCLDAILNSTLKDLELILVDDGSTDGSQTLCDVYRARNPERIRVVHQANAGIAAASNCGLELARGDYVHFHDDDDYVTPDFYEKLLARAREEQAEICRGEMLMVRDGQVVGHSDLNALIRRHRSRLFFFNLWWTAIYSRALLAHHGIRFHEELCFGVDTLFQHEALLACRHLGLVDGAFYCYCRREDSTDAGLLSRRQLRSAISVYTAISAGLARRQEELDVPGMAFVYRSCAGIIMSYSWKRTYDPVMAAECRGCVDAMLRQCPAAVRERMIGMLREQEEYPGF